MDEQRQPEGSNAEMMDLPNAAPPAPSHNRMWAWLLLKAVLDCAFCPQKFRKLPCWAMHAPAERCSAIPLSPLGLAATVWP